MNRNKIVAYCLLVLFFVACKNDDPIPNSNTLEAYIGKKEIKKGIVIACSASDMQSDSVLTFFYIDPKAHDIKYYETVDALSSKNDYTKYLLVETKFEPIFKGYMGRYKRVLKNEKWIIVTYEIDVAIKTSNPIRTKQLKKKTIWGDSTLIKPLANNKYSFTWPDNLYGDNAIYFQVISDSTSKLYSGTYTNENTFVYYDTSNVVFNITRETPPQLKKNNNYKFTLMDVSVDNWVGAVYQKVFKVD